MKRRRVGYERNIRIGGTIEAIVFRGNLQNVSFHRGPYEPNWFVIPFYRRPSDGKEGEMWMQRGIA